MADKFRTTFTIPVTFAAGEQPTNTKLNSVSTQSRNGLALLERAIGDLWNQGGDATSSAYPNRIVNIARALGDQALLTSKIPLPNFTGTASVRIRQPIANFLGKSEILLDFKPTLDATLRNSVSSLRYTVADEYSSSETTSPTTDSEWAIDTTKGRIKLGAALYSSQPVSYIEYNVAAADFSTAVDSLNASSFSMVPNQTQTDWKGLKICQIAANQYNIVLPFRRPDASPAGLSKLPLNSNNSAEVGSPSVIRYWGPAASGYSFNATISSNKFYRYTLPQVVLGMFTSPVAGTVIPSGSLYLWDTVTNTIVEGVTFKVPSITPTLGGVTGQQPFILQVDGASLDQVFNGPNGNFTSSMTTDVPADYMSRFALICVGQSLADAVSQLRKDLTEGDASVGPRKRPSHRDLAETQPAVSARHAVNIPPSFVDGDDHPHLLSRLGSADSATTTAHRDRFNNGILGNLLLLSTNSGSNYQNLSAVSNYLYFGSVSSLSPRIRSSPQLLTIAPAGVSRNIIDINNASLQVGTGIVRLGDGTVLMPNNRDLAIFDDGGAHTGRYWGNRVLLNATTQTLSTFVGTVNSTRYIDIDATTTNLVTWKGGALNLSAVAADTNPVVIGSTNTSTHLRLANNQLHFGTTADNDTIKYNDTAKTFTVRADGTSTAAIDAAILVAGKFRATTRTYQFGGTDTSAPDDVLVFDDSTNTFSLQADGATNNSILEAGKLRATLNEILFGTGTSEKITFGSNIFTFTGDISAGTITGSVIVGGTFTFSNEPNADIFYSTSKDMVINEFNGNEFDGVFQSGTIRTELIKPNHAVVDLRKYIRDIVIDLGSATFKSVPNGPNDMYSVGAWDHDIAPLVDTNHYAIVDLTPYLGYNPRFYQIDFKWRDLYAGTGQITEVYFQDNEGENLWLPDLTVDYANRGDADSSSFTPGAGNYAGYSQAYLRTNTTNTTQNNDYIYRIASYDGLYFSFYHDNGSSPVLRSLKDSADRQIFLVFQTQEEDGGPAQPMMAGRYLRIVVGYDSLNDMLSIVESNAYPSFL